MKIFWTIYIALFVIGAWLAVYLVIYRKKGMEKRCTCHTYGRINRYSFVNYSGIHLPLVEYDVGGVRYKKVGPRFGGNVIVTVSTPFSSPETTYETNLTTRDDLPDTLKVKRYKNSMVSVSRSPLMDLYPIGADDVNVYYNPSNPREAYVERYCPPERWLRILLKAVAVFTTVIGMVAALSLYGAAPFDSGRSDSLWSGDINKANAPLVCEILKNAGLSNTDEFATWVELTEGAGSANGESSGFSDADCRMTVMLLAGDIIKSDSVEDEYNGDYLMFDLDAIDNDENYGILKDKRQLFTTMFGEMPVPESGLADALLERWKKHGIRVESEKCAVISILFTSYDQKEAFVGHTGLLIDCREDDRVDSDYVFVEKIAFGDPFKITLLKDENELMKVLSERSDYDTGEGETKPVVYKNDGMLGEL